MTHAPVLQTPVPASPPTRREVANWIPALEASSQPAPAARRPQWPPQQQQHVAAPRRLAAAPAPVYQQWHSVAALPPVSSQAVPLQPQPLTPMAQLQQRWQQHQQQQHTPAWQPEAMAQPHGRQSSGGLQWHMQGSPQLAAAQQQSVSGCAGPDSWRPEVADPPPLRDSLVQRIREAWQVRNEQVPSLPFSCPFTADGLMPYAINRLG